MAYARVRKGLYNQRCEETYTSTVGDDTAVDVIELNPQGQTVSITRPLPAFTDTLVCGFRMAIEGAPASIDIVPELAIGFCPSFARRFGEAGEYVLSCGSATRAGTYTHYTDASNNIPGSFYFYRSQRCVLWNAGSGTGTTGSSGYVSIPQLDQTWVPGLPTNVNFSAYTFVPFVCYLRRTGANTVVFGWLCPSYPHVCVPRSQYRSGILDGHMDTNFYNARQPWNMLGRYKFSVNAISGSYGTFTVDEATYGKFSRLCIGFKHPSARLLVRDFVCSQNTTAALYPI